jgi:hypothetical protein
MTTILGEYLGIFVWVYLDDVIVYSETQSEHVEHLRLVFQKLRRNRFFLSLDKCQFLQEKIKLLGHVIEGNRIHPCPERISKIKEWKTPTTKKELERFLGVINYIAPHLPHVSTIRATLTDLTGKAQWGWTPTHQEAFDQLRHLAGRSVALKPLQYDQVMNRQTKAYLVTDASKLGTGAFICHGKNCKEAKENIAVMHSRKFSSAQMNYSVTDQECLAVYDAL